MNRISRVAIFISVMFIGIGISLLVFSHNTQWGIIGGGVIVAILLLIAVFGLQGDSQGTSPPGPGPANPSAVSPQTTPSANPPGPANPSAVSPQTAPSAVTPTAPRQSRLPAWPWIILILIMTGIIFYLASPKLPDLSQFFNPQHSNWQPVSSPAKGIWVQGDNVKFEFSEAEPYNKNRMMQAGPYEISVEGGLSLENIKISKTGYDYIAPSNKIVWLDGYIYIEVPKSQRNGKTIFVCLIRK